MQSSEYPKSLESLIDTLGRLPGIGRRTAERIALALLDWPDENLTALGQRLGNLKQDVRTCTVCGNFADHDVCRICSNPTRNARQICVVEQAVQIPVIERAGCYKGLYHVLGGRIEPLEGKGPDDLTLDALRDRVRAGETDELIIATSSDVEGEATAAFLAEEFADSGLRITRIAAGVPVGADLSFADAATIAMAMNRRGPVR